MPEAFIHIKIKSLFFLQSKHAKILYARQKIINAQQSSHFRIIVFKIEFQVKSVLMGFLAIHLLFFSSGYGD